MYTFAFPVCDLGVFGSTFRFFLEETNSSSESESSWYVGSDVVNGLLDTTTGFYEMSEQ